ncbi:MAG TPA: carbon monoxide dehydrogenase subunit G [Bacillota bacterium]|nr:carbon monoxide dehydrogenase subunit G [Bacillota bacterium]
MQVEGQVTFAATPDRVWQVLRDRDALKKAIPGCETLQETGPGRYQAALKLGIAAVKGSYTAEVSITEERAPSHYRLKIAGQGGPGFVNMEGDVDLSPAGAQTAVGYKFDVQVGGVIAAVGQRMLGGVGKMLAADFFKAMQQAAEGA